MYNPVSLVSSRLRVCVILIHNQRLPLDSAHSIIQSVLSSKNIPSSFIHCITERLIDTVLSTEETQGQTQRTSHRSLLSMIQQRHPSILQNVVEERMAKEENMKGPLEQLVISLSLVSPPIPHSSSPVLTIYEQTYDKRPGADADNILASIHADSSVRIAAVHGLFKVLSKATDPTAPDMVAI